MSFDKDTYRTPLWFFRWLEARFAWFHFDGCANAQNALRPEWIGDGGCFPDFLADDLIENLLDVVGLILSTLLQARKRKATARGKWWWCSIRLWNDFVQRSVSLDFIKKVGGYGEQKTAQD